MTAILARVRLSEFWARMDRHLGAGYARTWARDQTLTPLRGRTVCVALEEGEDPKLVWRAVCEVLSLPARER